MSVSVSPWFALLIPVVFALSLWLINQLAIIALLKPARFVGLRPCFGWQGLLPARAATLAPALMERILASVVTVPELYRMIDPQRLAEHLTDATQPRAAQLVEHLMLDQRPGLWDALPEEARHAIVMDIRKRLPETINAFLADLEQNIEELLNIQWLTQRFLVEHPEALCRLVYEVGQREFATLIRTGWHGGLLLGLLPMTVWLVSGVGWPLLVSALLAGMATNQLGRLLVFRPRHNVRLLGITWRKGSFFKHQHDSALAATRMLLREIACVRNFATALFESDRSSHTWALARRHVTPLVEGALATEQERLISLLGNDAHYQQLIEGLIDRTVDTARQQFDDPAFNRERQAAAEQQLVWRVRSLTAEQFEALIRPVIRNGERLLVLLGGGVGAALAGLLMLLG